MNASSSFRASEGMRGFRCAHGAQLAHACRRVAVVWSSAGNVVTQSAVGTNAQLGTTSSFGQSVKYTTLALTSGVCYLPHPEKLHYGGEDAHFVSTVGGGAVGVSDGVGGWSASGVNPAEYSRSLMRIASAYLEGRDKWAEESKNRQPGPFIDPRGALHAAHIGTRLPGSATACVVQLDPASSALAAANLGDSGFMVVRDGRVVMKSAPLQHYFDCPYQFGAYPEFVDSTDTAEMAQMYNVPVLPGDFLVAGSDGLWDNCPDAEIAALCQATGDGGEASHVHVQDVADRLAALARRHAEDDDFMSPYTKQALEEGFDLPWWEQLQGMSWRDGRLQLKHLSGGKMDDITVIVARVELHEREVPVPSPAKPLESVAILEPEPVEVTVA